VWKDSIVKDVRMVTVLSLIFGIHTFLTPKQLGRFWLSLVLVVSRNNVEQNFYSAESVKVFKLQKRAIKTKDWV